MGKDVKKYIKIIITVVVIGLFVWFLVLLPYVTFRHDEKSMEEAARRYFELNSSELPTGERIATVSLQTLYYKAFLKDDFYIPYTKEACSVTDSWVKVKRTGEGYKYYTYLKCGALASTIDHKGPVIKLNGDEEITVNKNEAYKELGVSSVVDNVDGKINTSSVTIKGNVDTKKVGTYKVDYIAFDSLKNKTVATRTVKVVEVLKNTVKEATNNTGIYKGANPNNYLYLSGMLFRIIGVDGDNVKIVASEDIANVNYDGLDDWLKYYYKHITASSKKLLVKNKYCDMTLSEADLNTTNCTKYTKEKEVYIPSVIDVNGAEAEDGNYLKPQSISWLANKKDNNNMYVTRKYFLGDYSGKTIISQDKDFNYGVRPVLTIKGSTLVRTGDGTESNPYSLGDNTKAKADDLVNTRNSGEYVKYSNMLWRIVEVNDDGTTKVISNDTIKKDGENIKTYYDTNSKAKIYNSKENGNVGYYINNKASEFVDTSYFANKKVNVPIYKNKIAYGKESDSKSYTVKLSAPNMYEMFSAFVYDNDSMQSYWFINSSKTKFVKGTITDIGVVFDNDVSDYLPIGIRVVGNLDKKVMIMKGNGTKSDPYIITK